MKNLNNNKFEPLISIVTVTYNCASTISQTIKSVLCQEYDNFEFIVIDGLSTDNTVDIVKGFELEFNRKDINLKLVQEADKGPYDAMNKAVEYTSGDFIIFLGGDDLLIGNSIQKVATFLGNPNTIFYGDVYMPKRHKIYDGKFNEFKFMLRNICHQGIFYPREIFNLYKYNLKYKTLADYELNLQCYANKKYSFKYMPILVSYFNDYDGLSKDSYDFEFNKIKNKLLKIGCKKYNYVLFVIRSFIVKIIKRR